MPERTRTQVVEKPSINTELEVIVPPGKQWRPVAQVSTLPPVSIDIETMQSADLIEKEPNPKENDIKQQDTGFLDSDLIKLIPDHPTTLGVHLIDDQGLCTDSSLVSLPGHYSDGDDPRDNHFLSKGLMESWKESSFCFSAKLREPDNNGFVTLYLTTAFLLLCINDAGSMKGKCLNDQKSLLLGMKSGMVFISSASSKMVHWNATSDCCFWHGVTCSSEGRVVGSLPDSIGHLHNLSRIELSNCSFVGAIPSTMANLTSLVYVDFSYNNFTGSFPSFQMSKKLIYIDLSHNVLTGPLSFSHFEGLSELKHVNLRSNLLTGKIPPYLFYIPSLKSLYLNQNLLEGQVDEFDNASASQLLTLDLSSNRLNGSIPNSFFKLPKLSVLSLSSNFFSGKMQFNDIEKLPDLSELDLSYNNLTVDTMISNEPLFSSPLTVLNLASCKLLKFPDLRNQSKMKRLDLSDNQIVGTIPNWIWNVGNGGLSSLNLSCNSLDYLEEPYSINSSLSVIDLHSNRLQGNLPIPPVFALYVDYSGNNFSSAIPNRIGTSLVVAVFFSLSNNRFTGPIPDSVCNSSWVQVLDLSQNLLSGKIPSCLMNSSSIVVLDLRRNNLSGTIPDEFPDRCAVKTLDLSRNMLEGQMPESLVNCRFLEVLNVGNNKIVDRFPCPLRSLSTLHVLVLHSNRFFGDLHCLNSNLSWKNLQIIDISSNKFSDDLFRDNPGLCGFPLNVTCNVTSSSGLQGLSSSGSHSGLKTEVRWEYVGSSLGFVVDFFVIDAKEEKFQDSGNKCCSVLVKFQFGSFRVNFNENVNKSSLTRGKYLTDQQSLLLGMKNIVVFDSSASTKMVGWNASSDCCFWHGLRSSEGRVVGLDLSSEAISAVDSKLLRFRYSSLYLVPSLPHKLLPYQTEVKFGELRNSLNFKSGAPTNKLANWYESKDCCHWPGVKCDNLSHVIGLSLDNEAINIEETQYLVGDASVTVVGNRAGAEQGWSLVAGLVEYSSFGGAELDADSYGRGAGDGRRRLLRLGAELGLIAVSEAELGGLVHFVAVGRRGEGWLEWSAVAVEI
nr:receptor-like protein 12 [Ipomoea batatas]